MTVARPLTAWRVAAALTAALLLAACDGKSAAPIATAPPGAAEAAAWQVVETFGVGDNAYVRSFSVDAKADRLWVGTSVGVLGIDLASRDVKDTFTRQQGLANEYVFAIANDSQGYTWFGTNGGGVSRYRDGAWRTFFPMHGLADYWVYSFGEQASGALWIGTWYGVSRFDRDSGTFTNYLEELVNEWVYGIGVDSRDRVWFGTEGGISMVDGRQWQAWTHADGLGAPNTDKLPLSSDTGLGTRARHDPSVFTSGETTYNPNYVFSVHVRADDTVWAGTWGGGASVFDGKQWRNYTTADGLAGNIVFSITEDKDGALWFGTDGGLSRFDGSTWQTLTRRDGLIANTIYAVAATPDGDIWAGMRGGVNLIGRK
jgi:ligand-binding sensor domain-containing protein